MGLLISVAFETGVAAPFIVERQAVEDQRVEGDAYESADGQHRGSREGREQPCAETVDGYGDEHDETVEVDGQRGPLVVEECRLEQLYARRDETGGHERQVGHADGKEPGGGQQPRRQSCRPHQGQAEQRGGHVEQGIEPELVTQYQADVDGLCPQTVEVVGLDAEDPLPQHHRGEEDGKHQHGIEDDVETVDSLRVGIEHKDQAHQTARPQPLGAQHADILHGEERRAPAQEHVAATGLRLVVAAQSAQVVIEHGDGPATERHEGAGMEPPGQESPHQRPDEGKELPHQHGHEHGPLVGPPLSPPEGGDGHAAHHGHRHEEHERRHHGPCREEEYAEGQQEYGYGPVPEVEHIGDEQEAAPGALVDGLALEIVVHDGLVVLDQQFVDEVGHDDAGCHDNGHPLHASGAVGILVGRQRGDDADGEEHQEEVGLAQEAPPVEVAPLLDGPEL